MMSRFSRTKEKYGHSSGLSHNNYNEGTAARTRPFSFDEIMLSRKNKKLSGDAKEVAGEAGNKLGKDVVEDVSDQFEFDSHSKRNSDPPPGVIKCVPDDILKASSREKEENTSIKEHNLALGKDKASRESETKLKTKLDKEMGSKAKGGRIDKQGHGRRKDDGKSSDDSGNESEKKHSKNSLGKDRYADRSRGKSEREKRKHRIGDDEKNRDRNAAKKHDIGKRHDLEFSERRERRESPQSRYEESRPKRRRSRSREHEKDRSRRSISLSPRAHNRASYHGREHGELPSHSLKDKSGRQHSDADRNRISVNGSSSHYRRLGGFASGLGGYSPRKRRTEAAIKTPSPTSRSPEKKSAGWDLPPAKADNVFSGSVLSNFQSAKQTVLSNFQSSKQPVSSNVHELPSAVPVVSSTAKPLSGVFATVLSTKNNVSIDSIQLTQATRPLRRLYVENVPASVSEKAIMERLNSFLLSSGVNHIQGTQPCISCIIHKEKGQALVEFLTPEDASAALSFDGCSFSGSILKIRRPKDFVEVATGVPEKSVAAVDAISDIVKDSPHKIFIGGISKVLSSEMIMEIASAFGPLKAYHFQINGDLNEPCAFLEYLDQSITLKACAGLNGMKLGGQVLIAVQAIPNAPSLENTENSPSYGIPEHAKPLLEKPTQILKINNVFNPEDMSSLSEPEMEEVLEDIRLECARFGSIKSVNVVKYDNSYSTNPDAYEVTDHMGSAGACQDLGCDDENTKTETLKEVSDHDTGGISREVPSNAKELMEVDKFAEHNNINDDKPANDRLKDGPCESEQIDSNMAVEEPTYKNNSDAISQELPDQLKSTMVKTKFHDDKVADIIQNKDFGMENKLMTEEEINSEESNVTLEEAYVALDGNLGIKSDDAIEKGDNKEQVCDLEHLFELGCVLVEYGRTEASCIAAHCLHGRCFDGRIVSVGYVAHDLYRARFPK